MMADTTTMRNERNDNDDDDDDDDGGGSGSGTGDGHKYDIVQFAALHGGAGPELWSSLAKLKLETMKLSEDAVDIVASYECCRHDAIPSVMRLESVSGNDTNNGGGVNVPGELVNFNTMEGFKASDRQMILGKSAKEIVKVIVSGKALEKPELLTRFILLTFADLKAYRFFYWFAVPAILLPKPLTYKKQTCCALSLWKEEGEDHFSQQQRVHSVVSACESFQNTTRESGNPDVPCWLLDYDDVSRLYKAYPLSEWKSVVFKDGENDDNSSKSSPFYMLAFLDTSNMTDHPGWSLRNIILCIAVTWKVKNVTVLCIRNKTNGININVETSTVIEIKIPDITEWWNRITDSIDDENATFKEAVGWERDSKGKHRPRVADLKSSMDPRYLASSAVDLNLKLMRWRVLPELNVDKMNSTKCLLIGAGTLGCNVSRLLLAWGIRKITFVDNGKVSYSNPVRQSLYCFTDCQGNVPKAEKAAEALRAIYPDVDAEGICLGIPMPGHPIAGSEIEHFHKTLNQLDQLIQDHDIIFLLTDTRESRWLPTLLSAMYDKLCINAALGFDSYVVLRHGVNDLANAKQNHRLGCYFCNDVVAPLDSMSNRTLDQQCTVTRPGLAMMASAIAVEMMATLLHHPDGNKAASEIENNVDSTSPLGPIPHSIRGSLFGFSQISLTGQAFSQCTACSDTVVDEYKKNGSEFLLNAINEPKFLEDLTGLTALHKMTDMVVESWDDDEDLDDDDF